MERRYLKQSDLGQGYVRRWKRCRGEELGDEGDGVVSDGVQNPV